MMRGSMRPPPPRDDELGHRAQLIVVDLRVGRERGLQPRGGAVDVEAEASGSDSSGRPKEELLTVGELRQVDVDRAVREHAPRHVEAERAVDLTGEDLAADRVAHVVRDERDLGEAELDARTPRRCRPARTASTRCRAWPRSRSPRKSRSTTRRRARNPSSALRQSKLDVGKPWSTSTGSASSRTAGTSTTNTSCPNRRSDGAPGEPLVDQRHPTKVPCWAPMTQPRTHSDSRARRAGSRCTIGAARGAPRILLAHPTGFHGRVWAPVAERLVAAGRHVWSLDFRGPRRQ